MKKKVLICDDEPFIVESLAYILKKKGLECIVANNGKLAIEQARRSIPDIVFLDVGMPELDGLQVCRLLKNDPLTCSAYIIVLTAHGQASDQSSAEAAGANEFVTKPFSPRELSKHVDTILAQRS